MHSLFLLADIACCALLLFLEALLKKKKLVVNAADQMGPFSLQLCWRGCLPCTGLWITGETAAAAALSTNHGAADVGPSPVNLYLAFGVLLEQDGDITLVGIHLDCIFFIIVCKVHTFSPSASKRRGSSDLKCLSYTRMLIKFEGLFEFIRCSQQQTISSTRRPTPLTVSRHHLRRGTLSSSLV